MYHSEKHHPFSAAGENFWGDSAQMTFSFKILALLGEAARQPADASTELVPVAMHHMATQPNSRAVHYTAHGASEDPWKMTISRIDL